MFQFSNSIFDYSSINKINLFSFISNDFNIDSNPFYLKKASISTFLGNRFVLSLVRIKPTALNNRSASTELHGILIKYNILYI